MDGVEAKIKLFWFHIKLNGITNAATSQEKFARRPPHLTPQDPGGWGQKVKIQLFLEYCHVAYQINWNLKGSNMVATIWPADPLSRDPGDGVKGSKIIFFPKLGHVAYQIKRNDACSNMVLSPGWT